MRKILITILILVVAALTAFFLSGILEKQNEIGNTLRTRQKIDWFTDYIETQMDVQMIPNIPTVFIFFNPDCEFCQKVAEIFKKQRDSLGDVQWFWISDASPVSIDEFVERYKFDQISDLIVIRDSNHILSNKAQVTFLPQIFIYDHTGRLVKEFKGETRLSAILNYL